MLNPFKRTLCLLFLMTLSACTTVPDGVKPIQNFNLDRYLGTWYEIARLDHSFERGLSNVKAEYSLEESGHVRVINSGYSTTKNEASTAQGRAKFVSEPTVGHLKVSFFGPFYGSYVVFELGDDYDYAFIAGNNKNYLWLLARSPMPDPDVVTRFVTKAKSLGFATDELIFVDHQPRNQ